MNTNDLLKALSSVRDIEADDVFSRIGLERRRGTAERVLVALGIFGMGLVVGAGAGLLLSPVTPQEARKKLVEGANAVKDQIVEGAEKLTEEKAHAMNNVNHAAHNVASTVTSAANNVSAAANNTANKAKDEANRVVKNGIATNDRPREV